MELDYTTDIEIDENALDVVVLQHATISLKYGMYHAKCIDKVTRCEEALKLLKAEFTDEVIRDPSLLGIDKTPTAPMIEAYYRSRQEFKDAKEEWLSAKEELEIATVAKNEICYTRKAMIESLIKLASMNYFATPDIPRDLSLEAAKVKVQKSSNNKISNKLKRRK